MNRFPIINRLIVSDYLLYPGTDDETGIDFSFESGLSLLAGINGLGKTTLINMMFRLLVGPFELPKDNGNAKFGAAAKAKVTPWTRRRSYFTQRVPDRAQDAWAELHFSIGTSNFIVKRALSNLELLHFSLDGVEMAITINEAVYQKELCTAADAGQFVDFLTAIKYLSFFNEERRDILWDDQAQRQFFRILFTTPDEAREWIDAEQEISSADSRARNISATAYQYEQDLKKGKSLLVSNAGAEAKLAAQQAILDADLERRSELEKKASILEQELKVMRRDLERAKLTEDDARRTVEEIRFKKLGELFPKLSETSHYILTQLFADGLCLACDQYAPKAQGQLQQLLESNRCVVCGSDVQNRDEILEETGGVEAFEKAKARWKAATIQRDALVDAEQEQDQCWREVLKELREVTDSANMLIQDVAALRGQLPPAPEKLAKLEQSINELREREQEEKQRRQGAEAVYDELLYKVNSRIKTATEEVSQIFQNLIARFLEEKCSLKFTTTEDRPSQSGRKFTYPSLRFEMTAAAFEGEQIRDTPDDVSESQREFIDLAFRMALSEAASVDGIMSMVIETPEASLDVVFMHRAAALLREFAVDGRSIIVTSNLTSSVMIPALMGAKSDDAAELAARKKRVLNLLEIAAPNAALKTHKAEYQKFLETGLQGYDA